MEDVAKRLIDWVSRPDDELSSAGHAHGRADGVRDLAELDRFCDAMIKIREEIGRVAAGVATRQPAGQRPAHLRPGDRRGGNTPIPGAWRRFPRDCITARCTPTVQTNTGHQ